MCHALPSVDTTEPQESGGVKVEIVKESESTLWRKGQCSWHSPAKSEIQDCEHAHGIYTDPLCHFGTKGRSQCLWGLKIRTQALFNLTFMYGHSLLLWTLFALLKTYITIDTLLLYVASVGCVPAATVMFYWLNKLALTQPVTSEHN